jgi:hypothetical protein
LKYHTYDKELYDLAQDVKKWKYYLMGKETIIDIDLQPLEYLHAQNNLQQIKHYVKCVGFLQQFHLIIKYKKGNTNKLEDMISRKPTSNIAYLGILMDTESFTHDAYIWEYIEDEDFKEVFQHL